MNDSKIDPEWFKKGTKERVFAKNDELFNESVVDDINKSFCNEVAAMSLQEQELIKLILNKNGYKIHKFKSTFFGNRFSSPVNYYNFSKNINIQSVSLGFLSWNLSNNGYYLNYYDENSKSLYSICKIDQETIDVLYPGKIKRFGKKLFLGFGMFTLYMVCSLVGRTCGSSVAKNVMVTSKHDIINSLEKDLNSRQNKITENADMKIEFISITESEGAVVNATYKNLTLKDFKKIEFNLEEVQQKVNNNYCTNTDLAIYRKYNISMTYKYYSSDSKLLYELNSDNSKCNL